MQKQAINTIPAKGDERHYPLKLFSVHS